MNLNGKDYVFQRAHGDAEWWCQHWKVDTRQDEKNKEIFGEPFRTYLINILFCIKELKFASFRYFEKHNDVLVCEACYQQSEEETSQTSCQPVCWCWAVQHSQLSGREWPGQAWEQSAAGEYWGEVVTQVLTAAVKVGDSWGEVAI